MKRVISFLENNKWFKNNLFLIFLVVIAYGFFVNIYTPQVIDGKYRLNTTDSEWQSFDFPLQSKRESDLWYEIQFVMKVGMIKPQSIQFFVDDCISELIINDTPIALPHETSCSNEDTLISSAQFLHSGVNQIFLRFYNKVGPGSLSIYVPSSDWILILARTVLLTLVGFLSLKYIIRKKKFHPEWLILIIGIFSRVFYYWNTQFFVRAHDVGGYHIGIEKGGHVAYVFYVLNNWTMPSPNAFWEWWQPPLYYYISALFVSITSFIGHAGYMLYTDIQLIGLVCSIASLLLCFWIASLLFKKLRSWPAILFLLGCIFLPGIIYQAGRINNDVLVFPLMLASFGFLISWWKNKKTSNLIFSSIILSFALLTKNYALCLLPPIFLCIALSPSLNWKGRFAYSIAVASILLFLVGWLFVFRFGVQDGRLIGKQVGGHLKAHPSIENLVEFNPIRLIREPYTRLHHDVPHRQYYPEFLLRSAYFGEFDFGNRMKPFASVAMLFAVLLIPFLFIGTFRSLRSSLWKELPIWLTLLSVFSAVMYMRFFVNTDIMVQDFRLAPMYLIPITYFISRGIEEIPKRWRSIPRYIAIGSVASSILFLILLPFLA